MSSEMPSELGDAESWIERGVILARERRLDEAVTAFRRAAELAPQLPMAHHNLGIALAESGNLVGAAASLQHAIGLNPKYPDAYYNLGNVLVRLGRVADAAASFRRAWELRPDYVDCINNYALALIDLGRAKEATVLLGHAARLNANQPYTLNNLGLAYTATGEYEKAEAVLEQSLSLAPRSVDAWNNLANCYRAAGQLDRAMAAFEVALSVDPEHVSARWNRSLCLLESGDFERGWAEFEWRLRKPESRVRSFPQPMWQGEPLRGKTILLHAEQGWGDTFQFLRFAPLLQRLGAKVILLCPRPLVPLCSRTPGVGIVHPDDSPPPPFDVHLPLMSLPHRLSLRLETIPSEPYLVADPTLSSIWKDRLEKYGGFKLGIAWQGNPKNKSDRMRSTALAQFQTLANVPGVQLFSLQQGAGVEQLASIRNDFQIVDLGRECSEEVGSFRQTAAILPHLDLIVTVDTAIAHLAGAMGVPTWIILSAQADWRWLRERSDTPWYPKTRLFRQRTLNDWSDVFQRMADELAKQVHSRDVSSENHEPEPFADTPSQIGVCRTRIEVAAGISLCMIVKNEEANLAECLASVADLVDEIVVIDTGSSDRTPEIARSFGARVFEAPWSDSFAAARNESLRHARRQWIFWMDADDRLDPPARAAFARLRSQLSHKFHGYVMKCLCLPDQAGVSTVVDHIRLFRNDPAIRWKYRIHEQILPSIRRLGGEVTWTDVVIHHTGYQNPAVKARKRERDLRLLKIENAENPDDPFTLFNLGQLHQDGGDWEQALACFERSLTLSHPTDSIVRKLYALIAQIHRNRSEPAKAIETCAKGRQIYPDDPELLFHEALSRQEAGDWSGAEECYRRLLAAPADQFFSSSDPGIRGHKAHHNLAIVLRELKKDDEAASEFQRALALAPNFLPSIFGLAEVYLDGKRWAELDSFVERLRSQEATRLAAAVLDGRRALVQQDYANAQSIFESLTREFPQELLPWLFLSHVFLQSQNWHAAEETLHEILRRDPHHPEANRNLKVLLSR